MKKKTIYALGFFDGVHLGHQALLRACRKLADANGCQAGVVTFTTHPDALVQGNPPILINSPADRNMLLRQYHMDTVVELPFDRQLMQLPWEDFLRMLCGDPYNAAGLVCGNDFRFGHKGQGTAELLSRYCAAAGMPCVIVPEQTLDGIRVSSTHIRSLLEAGELEIANRFLGHSHLLSGEVVTGRQLGRTIGVPTANLQIPEGVVCLKHGVYACRVFAKGKHYAAVTNVGTRPTVGGSHVTVEPWLLDFEEDLYGQTITVSFFKFLRPERKFDSLEELQREIHKNAAQTRQLLCP